ncbi:MAG: DNA internalization-related competence protein ComEC/Rec2 [Candidatus Zixiibacteriota bacterium]
MLLLFIFFSSLLILSLILFLYKFKKALSFTLVLSFVLAGFFIHELKTRDFTPDHITHFLDLNQKISLSGTVCRDPDIRADKTFLTIDAESILLDETFIEISGRFLVKVKSSTNRFNYGDHIRVRGYLRAPYSSRNPGAFDYKKYLAQSNIFGLLTVRSAGDIKILFQERENPFLSYIVYPVKHFILKVFRITLRGAHQALLSGFVLGERRDIPDDVYQMFTDTGTLHLLAISGSNVGLVVLFFFGFFRLLRIPKKVCILLTLPAIVIFSYVTNNQPSVVRASIMAIIFLLAFFWEREKDLINILGFSALLILFFSPLSFFDVGFQLSFGVTLGLLIFIVHPDSLLYKISQKFKGFVKNWIILPLFVSLVAQITSYPILAYHFNQISLYAFAANLLVVPLVSLAVITGSMTVIAALFSISLAQILSAFNWLVLTLTLRVVEFFSQLPHATLDLPSPSYPLLILYYLFFSVVLIDWGKKARIIGIFSLVFLSIFILGKEVLFQKEKLEITFLDVGRGQSILIDLSPKEKILIDTGSKNPTWDAGERVVVPYLIKKNIRFIDKLILTSEGNQFNGGLESVLKEVKVKEAIILDSSQRFAELLEAYTIPYRLIGEDFDLDGNVKIFNYLPDKEKKGYLLTLEYVDFCAIFLNSDPGKGFVNLLGGKKFHLMGTVSECIEEEEFRKIIDALKPQTIILTTYEYPWDVLDFKRLGFKAPVFWTRDKGAIKVEIKGSDLRFDWMLGEERSKNYKLR